MVIIRCTPNKFVIFSNGPQYSACAPTVPLGAMAPQDGKDDAHEPSATVDPSQKIHTESQTEMLRRHTAEFEALTKEFEQKKSNISKKDRAGRAKLSELHALQGKQMRERHALELKSIAPSSNEPEEADDDGLFSRIANLAVSGSEETKPVVQESKGARRRRKKAEKKKAEAASLASNLSVANETADETRAQENDTDTPGSNPSEASAVAPTGQKLSRAARRRLKRAQEEAESEKRVAEERAAMGPGARQIEMKALLAQLRDLKLRVHQIPADGNCMYGAVLHQCRLSNESFEVEDSVSALRASTADYMLRNADDFMPFVESVDGDPEKFAAYCERIRTETVWGGQVELRAVAELLDACIEVYAVGLPVVRMGNESRPILKVSYHRKYFGLGEHYNSLVPIVEEAVSEN